MMTLVLDNICICNFLFFLIFSELLMAAQYVFAQFGLFCQELRLTVSNLLECPESAAAMCKCHLQLLIVFTFVIAPRTCITEILPYVLG